MNNVQQSKLNIILFIKIKWYSSLLLLNFLLIFLIASLGVVEKVKWLLRGDTKISDTKGLTVKFFVSPDRAYKITLLGPKCGAASQAQSCYILSFDGHPAKDISFRITSSSAEIISTEPGIPSFFFIRQVNCKGEPVP